MNATSIPPRRLLAELQAIEQRYPAMRLLSLEVGAPTLEGIVMVDGVAHCVRLTLPPGYPSLPPQLREIEGPGGSICAPTGGFHRFQDGSICLFPHGNDPQAWHRDRRAVEALDKFVALIHVDGDRAERRAGLLFREPREVYVSTGIAALLRWPDGRGSLHLRMAASGEGDLFADAVDVEGETEALFGVLGPLWSKRLPQGLRVPWVALRLAGRRWEQLAASCEHLDAALKAGLPVAVFEQLRGEEYLVLVRSDGDEQGVDSRQLDAVFIRRSRSHLGALQITKLTVEAPQERLFHRVDGVMGGRERLADVRVVVVGLGSLGGAVALALARAGIRRFVLIDPDRLSIDNICRHVGTTHDIGRPKVDVVEEILHAINPEVEVTPIAKSLAWDLPSFGAGVDMERLLATNGPTVVIMTCAVHIAERQLNAVAVERGTPVIYAAALGAAEHARIFRVIPGETPCYECILAAQDADPTSFPRFIRGDAQGEQVPYLEPALPGLGLDIMQIAMITARFALQTAARVEGIDLGYPDEPGDHLLWTNRGGWIFDRSLQIIVERVPRSATCTTCGEGRVQKPLTDAEQEALNILLSLTRSTARVTPAASPSARTTRS